MVLVRQRRVTQFVQRVGGVGNQFANRDFTVLVERFRQQVQQPADFGLECELFFGCRRSWRAFLRFRKIRVSVDSSGMRRRHVLSADVLRSDQIFMVDRCQQSSCRQPSSSGRSNFSGVRTITRTSGSVMAGRDSRLSDLARSRPGSIIGQ